MVSDIPEGVRFHPAFAVVAEQKFGELRINKEELARVYVIEDRFIEHLNRIAQDQGVVFVIEDMNDWPDLIITWTPADLVKESPTES